MAPEPDFERQWLGRRLMLRKWGRRVRIDVRPCRSVRWRGFALRV